MPKAKSVPKTNVPIKGKKADLPATKVEDLRTKPDRYLECYEFRHAWTRVGFFRWGEGGVCRLARCERCGTTREVYFRSDNSVMDSRYDYPDHYLRVGTGSVRLADVLAESMRRNKVYASRERIPSP